MLILDWTGGRKRRQKLALVLCYSVFCYGCVFAFDSLDVVFHYNAKRLAGKNVSELTYFVSGGM